MANTGRPLKRFLGLRRQKVRAIAYKGGIDTLQPGRLAGWVVAPEVPLHEVRLLVGPHLIARAEINQPRPDVCDTLGWQGKPGFSVELPADVPAVNWQDPPRLIALSADGSQQVEVGLLGRKKQTAEVLQALLRSDLLGLVGHCDGLVMGSIRGWACRRGQQRPAQIWLQCASREPVAVACQSHREGLQAMNLPSSSGFVVDPWGLPGDWAGQEVWLSFDREGQFRLPQAGPIVLPSRGGSLQVAASAPLQATVAVHSYQPMLEAAPADLQEHWQALEDFRIYLDGIEQQLAQQRAAKPATPVRRGWWARALGG